MDNIRITRAAARAAQLPVEPLAQNSSSTEAHQGPRAADNDDASSGGSITSGMVALGLQSNEGTATGRAPVFASTELRELRAENRNLRAELERTKHDVAVWRHFKTTHYMTLGYSSPADMQSDAEKSLQTSRPTPSKKVRADGR